MKFNRFKSLDNERKGTLNASGQELVYIHVGSHAQGAHSYATFPMKLGNPSYCLSWYYHQSDSQFFAGLGFGL